MKKMFKILVMLFLVCIFLGSCDLIFGEHSCIYTDWTVAKDDTCLTDGVEKRYCIICFKSDERVISAKGHNSTDYEGKDATCTEEGRTEGRYCSVCNEVISGCEIVSPKGHAVVIDPAIEPTEDAPGRTEGKHCSVCGEIIVKQTSIFFSDYSNPARYHDDYAYESLLDLKNGENIADFYNEIDMVASDFHQSLNDAKIKQISNNDTYYVAEVYYSDNDITKEEALAAWSCYIKDHPLYYWLSNSASCTSDYITLAVDAEYADGEVREDINADIYDKVEEYIVGLQGEGYVYQITLAFHDMIISNADYAYESDGITPSGDSSAHNILGVLLEGEGVCESYAKAFQLLLNYCSVENIFVTGYAGENHAWNLVQLDDGEWYWYDLTWDDSPDWMLGIRYNYFCVTDTDYVKWNDGGNERSLQFIQDHEPSASGKLGVEYAYPLPERAETSVDVDCLMLRDDIIEADGLSYVLVGFNVVSLIKIEAEGEIVIPESINYNGCKLTVKYIGRYDNDNRLLIPGSIIEYDSQTGAHVDVTSIYIPDTVEFIWDFAFDYCYTIREFKVSENNPTYTSSDGVLFTKSLFTLIKYPIAASRESYTTPQATVEIAFGAFGDGGNVFCPKHLDSLIIQSFVERIGTTNGGYGFRDSLSHTETTFINYIDRLRMMFGSSLIIN